MILGIGIDIVEIERFALAMQRRRRRLKDRFFTSEEQEYCETHQFDVQHYAARFAAKEAFSKAIGYGIAHGIQWIDVEIRRSADGRPTIQLHNRALELFRQQGGTNAWVSLSHGRNFAAATVVLEKD